MQTMFFSSCVYTETWLPLLIDFRLKYEVKNTTKEVSHLFIPTGIQPWYSRLTTCFISVFLNTSRGLNMGSTKYRQHSQGEHFITLSWQFVSGEVLTRLAESLERGLLWFVCNRNIRSEVKSQGNKTLKQTWGYTMFCSYSILREIM